MKKFTKINFDEQNIFKKMEHFYSQKKKFEYAGKENFKIAIFDDGFKTTRFITIKK